MDFRLIKGKILNKYYAINYCGWKSKYNTVHISRDNAIWVIRQLKDKISIKTFALTPYFNLDHNTVHSLI